VKGTRKVARKNFNFPFGGSPLQVRETTPSAIGSGFFFGLYCDTPHHDELFNYVFMTNVNPTIDFSEFKAKIASGEIKRVELDTNYYTGYTTEESNPRRYSPEGTLHRKRPTGPCRSMIRT